MEESLQLRSEIGDPRMLALGQHNLGLLTREEGDYATTRELFAAALHVQWDQGDKWALAYMLEDIAVLAVLLGEPAVALRFAGAGSALREEIQAPRGPRGAGAARDAARPGAGSPGGHGRRGLGRGWSARARRGDHRGARVLQRRFLTIAFPADPT